MTLDNRMHNLEKKVDELCRTIKEEIPTMTSMELSNRKLIEEVIDKCDRRYASKQIEKDVKQIVYGFIGVVFSVLVAVIIFFIK